ncbi:MAG: RNA-binding protein [Christensenellaceae bacterium]|nr:RNA-binding protein [Christensenellaceae bacterium]
MKSKKELTEGFARNDEEKVFLASLLDKNEMAQDRGIPSFSKFCTQEQQVIAKRLLDAVHAEYHVFGGYENAERAIFCFLPEYLDESYLFSEDSPLAVVRAEYKGEKQLSHRDFLGSLMGIGIIREAVGDILTEENRCHFLIIRELLPFILQNLSQAGRASLTLSEIPLSELPTPEQKFEESRASVMSMRFDAVISAAFHISREKAAQYVNAGYASLNHLECLKGDKTVKDGDIISVKGLGKAKIEETGATSRKGRLSIVIRKYA